MLKILCWAAPFVVASSVLPATQDMPDPVESEIVVTARKMRKVDIEYQLFGPHLRRCNITRSSGDERIDRLVCAILRACIREGSRETARARQCITNKIDSIEHYRAAGGAEETTAPPIILPHTISAAAPSENEDQPIEKGEQVVVIAPKLPAGSKWRFRTSSASATSIIGSMNASRTWERCIATGETEAALRLMLGKEVSYSGNGVCKMRDLTISDSSISGQRRCLSLSSRSISKISGRYDRDRIDYTEATRSTSWSKLRLSVDTQRESSMSVSGVRAGSCTPKQS